MQDKMDKLIKEALIPIDEPDIRLNQKILCSLEKKGRNNMKKNRRMPAAAVIIVCLLCIGSGTVYAAAKLLREMQVFDYGMVTKETAVSEEMEADNKIGNADDSGLSVHNTGEIKESVTHNIVTEEGTAETPWLSKEVQEVTEYLKESDDAVNWKEDSYLVQKTIYTFADYGTAVEVAGMDNWLSEDFEETESVIYTESVCESEEMNIREITAAFRYGAGYFEVTESKDMNILETEEFTYMLLTGETSDSWEYTNAYGDHFTITSDENEGKKRFNTVITYENYTGYVSFYDMPRETVCRILDTVAVKS